MRDATAAGGLKILGSLTKAAGFNTQGELMICLALTTTTVAPPDEVAASMDREAA